MNETKMVVACLAWATINQNELVRRFRGKNIDTDGGINKARKTVNVRNYTR